MNRFITENKLPYKVNWSFKVIGKPSKLLSRFLDKDRREQARVTGKLPKGERGRSPAYIPICTFCGHVPLCQGKLVEHYQKTHYSSARY